MMNCPICPSCKNDDILKYPSMFQQETKTNSFICNSCSFQWEEKIEAKK